MPKAMHQVSYKQHIWIAQLRNTVLVLNTFNSLLEILRAELNYNLVTELWPPYPHQVPRQSFWKKSIIIIIIRFLPLKQHPINLLCFHSVMERTYPYKTQSCLLSIACCDLLAAIFQMLKIPMLLFATRIELENNRRLTLVKTKATAEAHEA